MTGPGIRRADGETWLEAALRLARPHDLEDMVREHYQQGRALGVSEEEAALHAVIDLDIAEPIEDDE